MSSRNFRKHVGNNALPPPADGSDGEYEPLYTQRSAKSSYQGLVLSSQSESDRSSPERREEEDDDTLQDCAGAVPSGYSEKKKNYKKKGKGKAKTQPSAEHLDEVERSVQEVNAILGPPPQAQEPEPPKKNMALILLAVDPKHLNVANEARRLFGPDESEQTRRMRDRPNRALMLKRIMVQPSKETRMYEFVNSGLSMTIYKEMKGRKYFIYNHDSNYQRTHCHFMETLPEVQGPNIVHVLLSVARRGMHVEAFLEVSDMLFKMEENNVGNEILENVVAYLQYVAHPEFILSNENVRLEYQIIENRPFHVAMLKYIYLLSNRACHRTALEIAKMLLILDPKDPMAMLCLIDILALRAREHEWLIEAIIYFDKQREAGLLYNIKYSNALAHFHVASKNKKDLATADKLIKDAILAHPQVFVLILQFANVSVPNILGHPIFMPDPEQIGTAGLHDLFLMYAKMTCQRWREPQVMDWLLRNSAELCTNYDIDRKVRTEAKNYSRCRRHLFQVWPIEYLRHFSILKSMSKLILDDPLASFNRPTCAWNPLHDKGINRYNYGLGRPQPRNLMPAGSAAYRFFQSMIPSTYFEPPIDD